jgi:uncharacterized protein YecE (DUF72 family)
VRRRTFSRRGCSFSSDAAALARRHDDRVAGRAWTRTDARRALRHAIEVRHPSFDDPAFYDLLQHHGVALVTADTAGRHAMSLVDSPTADFAYARLHGDTELYVSGYEPRAIDRWARRVRAWSRAGRDVYVYFDNDAKAAAPFDAAALASKLHLARDVLPEEVVVGPEATRSAQSRKVKVSHERVGTRPHRVGLQRPRAA